MRISEDELISTVSSDECSYAIGIHHSFHFVSGTYCAFEVLSSLEHLNPSYKCEALITCDGHNIFSITPNNYLCIVDRCRSSSIPCAYPDILLQARKVIHICNED